MKRLLTIVLCFFLLACVPVSHQNEQSSFNQNSSMSSETVQIDIDATPEPNRYPVADAITVLPETIEAIDLGKQLIIYEAEGATYLYVNGESVILHQGHIYPWYDNQPNYQTQGSTLSFIEPNEGTLHFIDLNNLQNPPTTVDPEAVYNVKSYAVSQSGNEILFLKEGVMLDGSSFEALYYYTNGEVKRIEESVGSIGSVCQFSLSIDGKSILFYAETDSEDEPFHDYWIPDGSERVRLDELDWISDDLRSALIEDPAGILTLYREGCKPTILSNHCRWCYGAAETGECWWTDQDEALWFFDGTKSVKIAERVSAPRFTLSGAYAFFRDGVFWAMYSGGDPVYICSQEEFAGAWFKDENTLIFCTSSDRFGIHKDAHRTAYTVTVNENGVSQPVLSAENNYQIISFLDDQLIVRSDDMSLVDLYYKDMLIGTNVRFWSSTHFSVDEAHENLFFISENRLYHFDGKTLKAVFDVNPSENEFPLQFLDNGTFLYHDGSTLFFHDGVRFHRILEDVIEYHFATTLMDALMQNKYLE